MKRPGRPSRTDHPQRTTLYLSTAAKGKLYLLAMTRGESMGRTVEGLIERAAAREMLAAAQRALDEATGAVGGGEEGAR
jgi:hypothetical protein